MADHETTLRELAELVEVIGSTGSAACLAGADALRAALGTCATCAQPDEAETHAGYTFCAAPDDIVRFPFTHKRMPLDERCKGWTPKEGA